MKLLRRLVYWLRFRARENELREEIASHRSYLVDDFRRQGMSSTDAELEASRAMGNDTYMREESRGVWLSPRLDASWKDWTYAWRGLRRSPVFTLVAVSSLGLGIGANTAIFSVIHALLLARVPIHAAAELVQLRRDYGPKGMDDRFTRSEFDILASTPMPLTMFASTSATVAIAGTETSASIEAADGSYFAMLGIRSQSGRLLFVDDDREAAPVVVITERFRRAHLSEDSIVVGRTIEIDRHPFTIIGVAPPGFAGVRFPAYAELFIPYRTATSLGIVHDASGRAPMLVIVGRRAVDLPVERAGTRLQSIWSACCANGELVASQGRAMPHSALAMVDASRGVPNVKLDLRGQYSRILLALMAGVGILLLAACANVANLLVARSTARTGELAVRLALGASRARLVAQLVIESVQLSMLGALLGLLIARWGLAILIRLQAGELASVMPQGVAPAVLAFTVTVSFVAGLVFGVAPAVRVLRSDLTTPLKQSGRRASASRGIVARGLVALQMALALLLVSGAALLVETLRNLQHVDLGFDADRLIAVTVETRHTAYERQGMTTRMADEILRQVRAIPGVRSAGFGSNVPVYGGRGSADRIVVRGAAPGTDAEGQSAWFAAVSPGYFTSMGMSMRRGRDFSAATAAANAGANDVVVNERFARTFFPDRDPLGQLFDDVDDRDSVRTNRVIGVVADAKYNGLREQAEPMYFVPVADGRWPFLVLVMRLGDVSAPVGAAVARVISGVAPGVSQGDPTFVSTSIDAALARERMSATLALLFGGVALGLAAVGLYGVMLYQVAERTAEIGIRMALGARATTVLWLVLKQSLTVVGVGIVAGFPLALLAGRAVASQLYGIAPYSPWALAGAAVVLLVVAVAATMIPAQRAITVDPLTALRGS